MAESLASFLTVLFEGKLLQLQLGFLDLSLCLPACTLDDTCQKFDGITRKLSAIARKSFEVFLLSAWKCKVAQIFP